MVHLDYRDARPIYTQIADNFRSQILAGILRSGDKLPSVRELAASLAINPNTIQRAYRELELEGWIASVPGKGSFVSNAHDTQQDLLQAALAEFDAAAAKLLDLGMTREALRQRLIQGGDQHA